MTVGNAGNAVPWVLYGRDCSTLGAVLVESLGPDLAAGISAGAVEKRRPPVDANEDVCAIATSGHASLLAVADAHYGREAAEIAIEHVIAALAAETGQSGPPAHDAITIIHDASVAVQRGVGRAGARNPDSRTTLAFARVYSGHVEWGAFGDSSVLVVSPRGTRRLDRPRPSYLGYWFTYGDVQALATSGVEPLAPGECVVLASDGFVDSLSSGIGTPLELATAVVGEGAGEAADLVRRLIEAALLRGAADAVSVAVGRAVGD